MENNLFRTDRLFRCHVKYQCFVYQRVARATTLHCAALLGDEHAQKIQGRERSVIVLCTIWLERTYLVL